MKKILIIFVILSFTSISFADINDDLFEAVKKGDKQKVLALIKKGANVNAKDVDGEILLIIASKKGHTEIAKLLITKGADVNAKDNDGETPLMFASENGKLDIINLVI